MDPVNRVSGPGVCLPLDNIDTDQLIPARFMSRSRSDGYGEYLLHDMRFAEGGAPDPGFILNQMSTPPRILVAGRNFGCGSSREAAVYALLDHGIGAIVAESFADIFRGNAARNGLLTVALPATDLGALSDALAHTPGAAVSIDLETCTLVGPADMPIAFDYDPGVRKRLLQGLDDLSATLEHVEEIVRFETSYETRLSWMWPRNPKEHPRPT